ncbi:MAG: hypothetical protein R6X19_11460 [Kiritimatiellia bacterium]
MSGPSRLRFVDELVGALVLGCVMLFLTVLFLAGRAQGWFEKDYELRTVFPPQGALDLQQGAEVRIQGAIAGRVGDIVPNEAGDLETRYILRGRFRDLVRTNSVAVVKKKFKVAGDSFVEITMGDRRFPQLPNDAMIPSIEDVQVIEKMSEILEDVRRTLIPMLEEVEGILVNVNGILSTVHEGKGVVGSLLSDEALTAKLHTISGDIEKTTAQVPAMMEEIKGVAVHAGELTEKLKLAVDSTTQKVDQIDIRPLLAESEATLRESRRLIDAATRKIEDTELKPVLRETESMLRETRQTLENLQHRWPFSQSGGSAVPAGEGLTDPMALPSGEAAP